MIQILPANPRRSFADQVLGGLNEAVPQLQQYFQGQNQRKALQSLGIDPSVLSLPEQGQAAFFKKHFAEPEVVKPLTELQQAQKALYEQRLRESKQSEDLFNKFSGNAPQEMSYQDESQLPDYIRKPTVQQKPQANAEEQQGLERASSENLRKLAAFAGQPGRKGALGKMAESELDRRKAQGAAKTKKEEAYFKMNEPKLQEIADTERKLDIENARYERMGQLFSDSSKFPSPLIAALFTKEGQIRETAYSQLSPEAQEAVKLIIDSTSNIKDTYGARVTNFDLQTYLRKLPSLLNSPEGRTRVLKDLQQINAINQLYNRGIQDIFDEAGGTDQIPWSTAEKKFKQKYGSQLKNMLKEYASPTKTSFSERPDPKQYLGKKIKDKETGEIFISDGNEWKPFEG